MVREKYNKLNINLFPNIQQLTELENLPLFFFSFNFKVEKEFSINCMHTILKDCHKLEQSFCSRRGRDTNSPRKGNVQLKDKLQR